MRTTEGVHVFVESAEMPGGRCDRLKFADDVGAGASYRYPVGGSPVFVLAGDFSEDEGFEGHRLAGWLGGGAA